MDITNFQAGKKRQQYGYMSFQPEKINHEWILSDLEATAMLAEANRMLGELNAFGQLIPNVDFFIKMHVAKEATTSNRIEGTQTTMEEALVRKEDVEPERRDDWLEVHNYVLAMNNAIAELESIPLSNRLLRQTHKILLSSGRGQSRHPGEFRKSQNWIGHSLKDAAFVPPAHEEVPDLMSDLELFLHNDKILAPHLVRIAIAHYQFETIHPFLDGNGRLGRLLITLYLVSSGLLNKPTLYLSDYLSKNRRYYYDYLTEARAKNDLAKWVKFFLAGVIETSISSIGTFKAILKLRESVEQEKVEQLGKRSKKAAELVRKLYANPFTSAAGVVEMLGVTPKTANAFIVEFERLGILKERTGFKRNRIFAFEDYLAIFNSKE
jgi:Fic family protein